MSIAEFEISQDLKYIDAHVVILNNYIRKHHVDSYRELAKRVRKLTVLLSTPMEPDRDWDPQWDDLDVRVQKNWMFTTSWKHSAGFKEACVLLRNGNANVALELVSQVSSFGATGNGWQYVGVH